MRVTLIAQTKFERLSASARTHNVWYPSDGTTDADALAEFAGRNCYQSWHRPNPSTRTSAGYHENVLEHGHFSIYEHASFTILAERVSRALTHELVRHRHVSPSQLSQRFVDSLLGGLPVIPPALRDDEEAVDRLNRVYADALADYDALVSDLTARGLPRKQAREAARSVLPNMTPTSVVLTGNVRAWRELVVKRIDPAADAEMQEFAQRVLHLLRRVAPDSVQDLAHLEVPEEVTHGSA